MKKVIKPLDVIVLIILIALTGCKKSDSGTNPENPSTPTIPTGAINGLFTINENGGQVYFSQGNLQYQASTDTWRFAEHQWDFVGSTEVSSGEPGGNVEGSSNHLISDTYDGWIDLFGWGTGNNPTNSSTNDEDYDTFNDWGYNAISNGGNTLNQWRTLTRDEWLYVFDTRSTPSGIRYAKAQVNGVNGVILLPDDWSSSHYGLNSTNTYYESYSSNTISASQWNTLEQHGAVFLPAAGFRNGTDVRLVDSYGYYWSTTPYSIYYARAILVKDDYLTTGSWTDREGGHCVRLVCPAEN